MECHHVQTMDHREGFKSTDRSSHLPNMLYLFPKQKENISLTRKQRRSVATLLRLLHLYDLIMHQVQAKLFLLDQKINSGDA